MGNINIEMFWTSGKNSDKKNSFAKLALVKHSIHSVQHQISTTLVVGLQTMRLQKKLHNTSWKITIESVPAKPNSWFMETALGLKTHGYCVHHHSRISASREKISLLQSE